MALGEFLVLGVVAQDGHTSKTDFRVLLNLELLGIV
jgi:hypothetical protein